MAKKFPTPSANPYGSIIQSSPKGATGTGTSGGYYRFNAKLPLQQKDYLQEMAWRNRITITEYIVRLIQADMEKHPEWTETLDILNK